MEESTFRNSRIGETREEDEQKERKNRYEVGRMQEEQEMEPAVDMMRKQRGYGGTQSQKKTTGVLSREQCHSKGWKQEV